MSLVQELNIADNLWITTITHFKELARYPLEDMLSPQEDNKFLLCLVVFMDENEDEGALPNAVEEQWVSDIEGK